MIDHVWTVLCSTSAIDIESNSLSLLNILEKISVKGRPQPGSYLGIGYDVVSLWLRSDPEVACEGHYRVRVLDPAGIELHAFEMDIDLTAHERARSRMHIEGLPASWPGRYLFVVELKDKTSSAWHQVARLPLSVTFQVQDDAGAS